MNNKQPPPPPSGPDSDPRVSHARAIVNGGCDRFLYNNLISLYSKSHHHCSSASSSSSSSSYSLRVFHQIPNPNVVSWTALIAAHSDTFLSLRHFVSMLRHPTLPNQRTLASLFKTCAALSSLSFGLALHALSIRLSLATQPFSGSALLSFYSKSRLPGDARKVFDEITEPDEVCYAAIVVGLAQNSRPINALSAFAEMISCDVRSTMYSVSGALRSAAELAALEQCRMVHCHAVVTGLDMNVIVGCALIDAYGKAGLVSDARRMFDEGLTRINVVGWNAMMAAYAQHGDKDSIVELFRSMEAQGLTPDEYSFLAILSSFCNAGLDVETDRWFTRMIEDYGLKPGLEHYTCVVGAFSRAGRLSDAEKIVETMPFVPDAAVWRAMLSASAHHGEADMAWTMAKRLLELDPHDDSAYVMVANALSSAGRWDEVAEVRKMMKDRRVKKEVGRSWIEVQGKVYVFFAGDQRHEMKDEIYAKLAELMEEIEKLGYVPVWDEMLHEVGEEEKRKALWSHSEKLALAFGIISGASPPGKALRIVKNLRICRDCHEVFRFMSRVLDREIIVRDVNRYHRFLNGNCTCGGVW
ncbi:DYW domain containing protein [Parasponia andersonii]|uniref:DYW domain containing protein n=1 Tax=Parasponia andersonii TaxID=3476 RepID=A0A2P5ANN5_PARAD|nr:DYW domain containing protein [Parasponia andersonii]